MFILLIRANHNERQRLLHLVKIGL